MSWSLGEAESLAIKAARGAGLPWGLAEEAGAALRWLEGRGLPGAEALAQLLTLPPGAAPALLGTPPEAPICPIRLGTALMDLPDVAPADLGEVLTPILLIPFLAQSGRTGALQWPGARAEIAVGEATASGAAILAPRAKTTFQTADSPESGSDSPKSPSDSPRRTRVPDTAAPHIATLATLAARTYAPATEASRAGAGAGVSDND